MSKESRKALARIASVRSCTLEEARQYCARIRSLQERTESTWFDVAQALLWLEEEGGHYTDYEVARRANEITRRVSGDESPKVEKDAGIGSGVEVNDSRIRKFEGSGQEQAYLNWIDNNAASGFVINVRAEGFDPMVHSADCPHLRPGADQDVRVTKYAKLCSVDYASLRKKGQALAQGRLRYCDNCDA